MILVRYRSGLDGFLISDPTEHGRSHGEGGGLNLTQAGVWNIFGIGPYGVFYGFFSVGMTFWNRTTGVINVTFQNYVKKAISFSFRIVSASQY